jgi:CBS domain-containing protein
MRTWASARDVMTREVVTVGPEMRVTAAARLMADRAAAGLTVVDRSLHVIGVLGEEDLVARLAPRRRLPWWQIFFDSERLAREYLRSVGSTVEDVMTRPPVTVTPDDSVAAVATLFASTRAGVIPVVKDGCLLGVIQRRDLLDVVPAIPEGYLPRPDAELAREMRARMAQEPWVSAPRVAAHDGILELGGMVGSEAERRALEAMARAIPGCRAVDSRLVTRNEPGRRLPAPAAPWPARSWWS